MTTRVLAVGAAATFALLLLFGWQALRHGVNADEGFYVLAAIRVAAGERLYADFFYPQMPYLPLLGAELARWLDPSLWLGRLMSLVPGAMLGGVLAGLAYRRSASLTAAGLLVGGYGLHVLSLNYLSVTKTYGLSNLCMVAGFLLAVPREAGIRRTALAGMLMGVALATRLPVVPVALITFFFVCRNGAAHAASYVAGGLLGGLPCLWVAFSDFDAFWFGNMEFHDLRKEIAGWGPILGQKLDVLARWFLLPQNLVLWVAAAIGWRLAPKAAAPPLACALGLGALYMTATPTYLEYMVQIIPFLLIAAIPAFAAASSRPVWTTFACVVFLVGLAVSLRPTAADSDRGRKLALWDLATVTEVSSYLALRGGPDDPILSWWEGYPWLSGRQGYKGVGFWEANVGKKLPAEDRRRYHVLGPREVRDLVEGAAPRHVVFPAGKWADLAPALEEHYRLIREFGAIRIYERASTAVGRGGV